MLNHSGIHDKIFNGTIPSLPSNFLTAENIVEKKSFVGRKIFYLLFSIKAKD